METPKENWDIFKPHKGSTETETMGKSLIKSDTKILQNALAQIEKMEADKAELLEALERCNNELYFYSGQTDFVKENKSLIQKHKQ